MLSLWQFSLQHQAAPILLFDALALLGALAGHFLLLQALERQTQTLERERLAQQQLQIENEKAEALMQAYTAQRRLTHEFRHHLDALAGLLARGETELAQSYLAELAPQIDGGSYVVNTRNPLLDAVLSQKYAQAAQQGSRLYFQLQDLQAPRIATPDLVVIVSNLLDNALEAAQAVPNGIIELKIQQTPDDFLISVRNQVAQPVVVVNNQPPRTTKRPDHNGMGLPNTMAVLKKYKASHVITCRDGWFQFTALAETVPE